MKIIFVECSKDINRLKSYFNQLKYHYKKVLNYLRKLHMNQNLYVKFTLDTKIYIQIYIRM